MAEVAAAYGVSRILTRHGLVTPEPKKRPRASYLRFQAVLPNQMGQTDFTHYRLAEGVDPAMTVELEYRTCAIASGGR